MAHRNRNSWRDDSQRAKGKHTMTRKRSSSLVDDGYPKGRGVDSDASSAALSSRGSMAASRVVYSAADVKEGDIIAYPGVETGGLGRRRRTPHPDDRSPSDWLKVTRVEGRMIFGTRVNPQDGEVGEEYAVFPLQVEENGVLVVA